MQLYMAIDQLGNTYHGLEHPRKDLLERIGGGRVSKMYANTKTGAEHIGYVIGAHWCRVFRVLPFHESGAE